MPNLTTPFLKLDGEDTAVDLKKIEQWSVSLIDELKSILCNLDAGNVLEAGSVKAKNIDCTKAKIKGAQIQSLTADKISAGTIDSNLITIKSENETDGGTMTMSGESLIFYEKCVENGQVVEKLRIAIGRDENGKYIFTVQSRDGQSGIYMDESGEVYMTGILQTTKDCLIQGELRVGLGGNNAKGIAFYGDSYFPDENGNYAKPYARIIPYVDSGGDLTGISVEGGGLWVKGVPVATQNDITNINNQIEELTKEMKRLEKMIDDLK